MSLPVHHLAVVARDLGRAERFYRDVLGLPVVRRWHDERGERSIWLALGQDVFLAVERADEGAQARTGDGAGWRCVALRIERAEREAWRARLAAAGCPVIRETSYTLYTRDPDGSLLGLSHYPDPAD